MFLSRNVAHGVVGHVKVDPAVAVEIGRHHSQTLALGVQNAAGPADVTESAIAQVPVETVGHPRKMAWMAIGPDSLHLAGRIALEGRIQVIHHVEIRGSVPVVVEECGAGAPFGAGNPCPPGDVAEGAVPVVAVKPVGTEMGEVEIGVPIVVVVAHGNSHAVVGGEIQAGFTGHLLQTPPARVAVERVGSRLERRRIGRPATVDQQHIQPAVAVIVQQRATRSHGLHQVLLGRGAALVPKIDAQRPGPVAERHGRVRPQGVAGGDREIQGGEGYAEPEDSGEWRGKRGEWRVESGECLHRCVNHHI